MVWLVAIGLAACSSDDDSGSPRAPEPTVAAGITPIRRLTKSEYLNTVRDLFGSTFDVDASIPSEEYRGGFDNGGQRFSVSEMIVRQYMTVATTLSQKVDLAKTAPCDAVKTGETACANALATKLGAKAYRRPLDAAEVSDLVGLYTTMRAAKATHEEAERAMIARMLIAPQFLYHVEVGAAPPGDGTSAKVTPYELAARLSYLFWESMPDDELMKAAADGKLDARPGVLAQADRLLADPRARPVIWHMNEQWLELNRFSSAGKDANVYPGFDAAKTDVYEGTKRFVEDAFWNGKGDLGTLLTGSFTYANASVASLYGFNAAGSDFTRVELDPKQSAGILTQPAFLATLGKADKSAPILRAVFIRDRLMCAPLPPPPPGASDTKTDAKPKTTREYFTIVTSPPSCMGCHSVINPIGFGLENFDGIGKWRTTENGAPIDASGQIDLGEGARAFVGASELGAALRESPKVQDCVTRQWFRFAYGHEETDGEIAGVVKDVAARFRTEGLVLRALPRSLVDAEPFYRVHYSLDPANP
jgi:hypothetical protein